MIDAPSPESIVTRSVKPEDQTFLRELYKSSRGDDLRGLGWDEPRISEFLDMQYEAQQNFYDSDYREAQDGGDDAANHVSEARPSGRAPLRKSLLCQTAS